MAEDDTTLSLVIEWRREDLEEAPGSRGRRRKVRFEVSEVTFTTETELHKGTEASGGVRWCALQAGATRRSSVGTTQTPALTMTSGLYDEVDNRSNRSPMNVRAGHPRPGR